MAEYLDDQGDVIATNDFTDAEGRVFRDGVMVGDGHDSDCSTHNEPAYPNGPCDCRPTAANIGSALHAAIGDSSATPILLVAARILNQFLSQNRIQVWVCAQGRYGSDVNGCEMETDRCGWRSWDEAVGVEEPAEKEK